MSLWYRPHDPAMKQKSFARSGGFTLIEVLVSLGVFLFAITVIVTAIGSAAGDAGNDARSSLAAGVLHDCFRDLEYVVNTDATASPTLKLAPVSWSTSPSEQVWWFDVRGRRVPSEGEAFFRCEMVSVRETAARLGHLRGRMVWPAKRRTGAPDGEVELFTSLLLP